MSPASLGNCKKFCVAGSWGGGGHWMGSPLPGQSLCQSLQPRTVLE